MAQASIRRPLTQRPGINPSPIQMRLLVVMVNKRRISQI